MRKPVCFWKTSLQGSCPKTPKLSSSVPPTRQIHLAKVDEFHLGALMMHFMLETIIMGKLMGVDPFDQPGVEEGKVLARQYLAEG